MYMYMYVYVYMKSWHVSETDLYRLKGETEMRIFKHNKLTFMKQNHWLYFSEMNPYFCF